MLKIHPTENVRQCTHRKNHSVTIHLDHRRTFRKGNTVPPMAHRHGVQWDLEAWGRPLMYLFYHPKFP